MKTLSNTRRFFMFENLQKNDKNAETFEYYLVFSFENKHDRHMTPKNTNLSSTQQPRAGLLHYPRDKTPWRSKKTTNPARGWSSFCSATGFCLVGSAATPRGVAAYSTNLCFLGSCACRVYFRMKTLSNTRRFRHFCHFFEDFQT